MIAFSFLWTSLWGKILSTFLISMVPVLELRGAIPLAVAHGLSPAVAIPVAVLGNLVPVPFIILFVRKVFAFMKEKMPRFRHVVEKLEEKGKSKRHLIEKGAFWGLFILVAIPLPGTGAWTGALVAAMLDLRLKIAFPSIFLGVIGAGAIVALASYGVAWLI
jgi:uncharacterized membrane protein